MIAGLQIQKNCGVLTLFRIGEGVGAERLAPPLQLFPCNFCVNVNVDLNVNVRISP